MLLLRFRGMQRSGRLASTLIETINTFPSYEHASRVYNSAEYQQGMKLRLGASSANLAIVEGFDG